MPESIWEDPRITAYVLGEMSDPQRHDFEIEVEANPELAAAVEEARTVTEQLASLYGDETIPSLEGERRAAIAAGGAAVACPGSPAFVEAHRIGACRRCRDAVDARCCTADVSAAPGGEASDDGSGRLRVNRFKRVMNNRFHRCFDRVPGVSNSMRLQNRSTSPVRSRRAFLDSPSLFRLPPVVRPEVQMRRRVKVRASRFSEKAHRRISRALDRGQCARRRLRLRNR